MDPPGVRGEGPCNVFNLFWFTAPSAPKNDKLRHHKYLNIVNKFDISRQPSLLCAVPKEVSYGHKSKVLKSFYMDFGVYQWQGAQWSFFLLLGVLQCPPLNRITLDQHESDKNNRMIQLTDVFCVLLRYTWASNFWLQ